MNRLKTTLKQFFYAPAKAEPIAALRIGIAAVLLMQAYFVGDLIYELYGRNGIIQGKIAEYFAPQVPHITKVIKFFTAYGFGELQVITAVAVVYVVSLVGLMVGFRTRVMAIVAWFTHMLLAEGHSTSYGADSYAHIFLFYLALAPAGAAWSVDSKFRGSTPTVMNRLALRVMQLHVAIAYCASGIEKAQGPQWLNGEAIWKSLMLPVYHQQLIPVEWISAVPWFAMIAGWGTLVIETFYIVFIFPKRTRPLWIALTLSLHIGIILFLGLHIFGIFMCVLTGCLFGVSAEPKRETVEVPSPSPALTGALA